MATKPTTMLEVALQYAQRGWKVYPLIPNKKVPHSGSNGHLDGTNEPDQVKDLFLKYGHNSNIGISLLDVDVIVLDIDLHTEAVSGFESLKEIEEAYEELPPTYTVSTPRRGEHRYYRIPGLSMNKDFIGFRPGLDVLSTKIYAPPSQWVDDNNQLIGKYTVKNGTLNEIADLPKFFLELIVQYDKGGQSGFKMDFSNTYQPPPEGKTWKAVFLEEMVDGVSEGNRNAWITSMFGKLIYSRMDVRKAVELIEVVNNRFVHPPISSKELERIINSVLKREISKRKEGT